ncbi:MAG: 3-oxoacyl-ACP reductase FabG [Candidatus Vesicomyosocius endoextente]|uniref:3-oxoacyl-[acyl-carrier-protein] reductase n=1 Tax=Candidatus Vesicomyosocius endoextente TaxID=2738853 RepID=A0A853GDA0_9GAMM|nr:3-oxoacyl-ACP reductase FabG [Candidatus Vesicomyosocius endoextente]
MNNLDGKIVLVTGASRGIGQAIALTLGAAGAIVIGTATNNKGSSAISIVLKNSGVTGIGMKLNVTNNEQIAKIIKSIVSTYGIIDILVNNAGIIRDNLLIRMCEDEWDDIIKINLTSVYKMSKAVLRGMMKKKSGRIISIASVVAAMGNAGQTNYAAAKSGIIGFTKSLAREVGSRNITINAIAPGFIETDMINTLSEKQKIAVSQQIPMNRLGTVYEVANAVLFLAGDSGSYITAQTLHVNGGMYTV